MSVPDPASRAVPGAPVDDWRPPVTSFAELLERRPAEGPFLTALDHATGTRRAWSAGEWSAQVASTHAALVTAGVRSGDRVGVLAGNDAGALAVAFACWRAGCTYLPLNVHEDLDRQAFVLRDAGAVLLAHAASEHGRAEALGVATGIRVADLSELTGPHHEQATSGSVTGGPAADPLDLPALRVYTSGTTGEPKGVELTLRNLLSDCDALQRRLGWDATTRVLVVLPIHHVNGLVVSSLLSWWTGGSAVLCDRFRSDRFFDDVAAEEATACSMVPSLLEFLLEEAREASPRVPAHFTEVLCGAGPLMSDTVLEFERAFGVPVRHLYGLSETTAVATMMPPLAEETRRGWYADHGFPSIGPAVDHVEVQVHDLSGEPVPPGVRGEIVVRGSTVMTGYAGREEATRQAFAGGWFHSGDEGFWQPGPDGTPYFFVSGRLKELIVRGGVNISPFAIDEVLRSHPRVRFALAVPFENRYYGEEIAAYVVPDGHLTADEVLAHCAERLDFAYQPKVVLFGEDVPFTATGKAKRISLRDQLGALLADYRDVQFRRRHPAAGTPARDEGTIQG